METIVLFGAGLLIVRAGQVLYAVGLCRSKNSAAAAVRGVADLCAAVLAFWAIGAAILFQHHNGLLGINPNLLLGWSGMTGRHFFYASVTLMASGVVGATMAERSKFLPPLIASVLVAAVLVPVAGHWVWENGWLARLGFFDVAGASVVHLSAGVCAAVGAAMLGARTGKYNRDGSANMIPGHNVPLAASGALVMFAAWFPYVIGSAVVQGTVANTLEGPMNVLLAGAAGGAAAIGVAHARYGKPDVVLTLSGLLGGLVAISAAGGRVGSGAAVIIGAVAGVVVPLAAVSLDLLAHLDDPTAGVSIHAVGGLWGTLAVGIFSPGSFADRVTRFGVQALGSVAIVALAAGLSAALFAVLRATVGLRVKEADEYDGLDLAEHDIGAYPDFQQTMIKSYHLREA
jgi:Amt family ammonium transporter